MRHQKKKIKLGRKKGPRKALLVGLVNNLIIYRKIKTTQPKAKFLQSKIEKLITEAKKQNPTAKRNIENYLNNKKTSKILYTTIAPKYKDKKSGYTRITKMGVRKGDGAKISQIELI